MKHAIILGILLLLVPSLQGQDRKAYVLHGHNGTSDKLQNMVSALNSTHKLAAEAFNYQSSDGIAQAGNDARSKMSGSNSLAIGHSMGGITLRQIDKQGGAPFSAAITVGTPHHGAEIARSLESGLAKNTTDKVTANIMAGPSRCPAVSFVNMLAVLGTGKDLTMMIQNLIGSKLSERSNQSSKELQPDAAFFQGNQNTTVPFVSIATYEDRNAAYRLAASDKNMDQGTAVTIAHGAGYAWMAMGVFYTVRGIKSPWTLPLNIARANAWFTGGAQLLYWTERDWNMLYAGVRTSDSMGDGFITAASQTFANAVGKIVVEDEGINHAEQRHHPRVFDEIRDVMESDGRYGRTFNVARR